MAQGGSAKADLDIDVVNVSGADAGEYLQSQLTQDVLALDVGDSAWSFLLTRKGAIIALMRVTRTDTEEFKLETEHGWGDAIRNTIDEFLGRMDVNFEQETRTAEEVDEQQRINRGWPRMGKEIDGSAMPSMTGIVAETIAFDKGCYVGQEFVARAYYRGVEPPRRLVQTRFDPSARIPEGAAIVVDGEVAGATTSVAIGVALGYLKRGIETPVEGTIGDVEVELVAIGSP